MRGRLIFPFLAELCRLSAEEDSYDHDFKEPALGATSPRVELAAVRVPCQVEPRVFEDLRMLASGNAPRSELSLVLHFRDLERLGLVDLNTGEALIRPNDRLAGLYDLEGRLVQRIRTPPGLYVTQAQPRGFGMSRSRPLRNLLLVTFEARQLAPTRVT